MMLNKHNDPIQPYSLEEIQDFVLPGSSMLLAPVDVAENIGGIQTDTIAKDVIAPTIVITSTEISPTNTNPIPSLVIVGNGACDDPEGSIIYSQV